MGSPAPQAFGGPDSTFGLRKNFGAVARSSCFAFCFFALVALFRCSLLLLLLVSLWLCCSIASRLACCLARDRSVSPSSLAAARRPWPFTMKPERFDTVIGALQPVWRIMRPSAWICASGCVFGFFGLGISFSMATIASWAQNTGTPPAVAFGCASVL